MHGMNYLAKRVNYPEKREETSRLWPRGPFSNSGNDFPKMWSVREEKAALEERGWDNEESGGGEVIYVYVSGLTFSPLSLPPEQIQGGNAEHYYGAVREHKCHFYDG